MALSADARARLVVGTTSNAAGKEIADAIDSATGSVLASGNILVGNSLNIESAVVLSGDATISNTGALTLAATSANVPLSTSPSKGVGYAVGAGAVVTQATNKATGVTINAPTGAITLNNAALAAGVEVTFAVTNSACAAADVPVACHASAGTAGAYTIECNTVAAGSFAITVSNLSAGSLSEAIVLNFVILKGAAS